MVNSLVLVKSQTSLHSPQVYYPRAEKSSLFFFFFYANDLAFILAVHAVVVIVRIEIGHRDAVWHGIIQWEHGRSLPMHIFSVAITASVD
jgi:hypothetical protein